MTIDIKLTEPIDINGAKVATLKLRRPKVRDMIVASKATGTDAEREVMLFANLCEVDPAVIQDLDMADYLALQKAYQGFLS